jgi:lipid-A-disaccharide synthase
MTHAAPRIMLSCGEASGDLYAAALVEALRAREPGVEVLGFGGPRLARTGASLVGTYTGLSVTGLVEALSVVPRSWRMIRALRDRARVDRPDVFVAIDFPDFNFRLLPIMHALGVPVVYYVSPQLWAWRAGRIETIRRYVTRMLVIFPFETAIYERAGIPVEFVGHPLVDLALPREPREAWLARVGLDPARPLVALLPGSRPNELRHMLPVLVRAARLIHRDLPAVQFVIARAPVLEDRLFDPVRALTEASIKAVIVEHATDEVLAGSQVAITASGTATIQAALHQRPMVVVYRLSPVTYAIGRAFVRLSSYGMVNLVAGHPVVPELIQDRFTPELVARETLQLLTDATRADAMRHELGLVKAALGEGGASSRAADAILRAARREGRARLDP